ncbi:MAG: hypothetical protein U1E78_05920 [Gammaproteobacteria bacterium]
MQQHIKSTIQLCLLKDSPETLPYSKPMLFGLIVLHFGLRWMGLNALPNTENHDFFGITLLWMACSLGLVYLLLSLKGLKERWFKVMLSLLSVDIFFLIILQLGLMLSTTLSLTSLTALIVNGAVLWVLLVKGRIFKIALGTGMLVGIASALMIEVLSNIPVTYVLVDVIENMKV